MNCVYSPFKSETKKAQIFSRDTQLEFKIIFNVNDRFNSITSSK